VEQKTFAVQCVVPHDSIKFDLIVYDSEGNSIDEGSVYHSNDAGVSWANWTFEQQDN
jgi:hypothetical protein